MSITSSSSASSANSAVHRSVGRTNSVMIRWAGQDLELFAERAVHWKAARTLMIADPHFGKAAAFRAAGVPVPAGTTQHNLDRLAAVLNRTQAARLIILGDFLHASAGRADDTMSALARWRTHHAALDIVLVRGNHDAHAGDPPPEWNITCVDEPWIDGPFAFRHEPAPSPSRERAGVRVPSSSVFAVAGHVHPCAVLRDIDDSSARVPCFHFSKRQAVLPAFGAFTGGHPIRPKRGDRVFAIAHESIHEIKSV